MFSLARPSQVQQLLRPQAPCAPRGLGTPHPALSLHLGVPCSSILVPKTTHNMLRTPGNSHYTPQVSYL